MLIDRQSKVVFPAFEIRGLSGSFPLFITVFIDLHGSSVDLRRIQIEYEEVLPLAVHELSDDLVSVFSAPVHKRHDLTKEQRTDDLLGLSPDCAPGEGVLNILAAGAHGQFSLLLIDQNLDKLRVRRLFQACSIDRKAVVAESY